MSRHKEAAMFISTAAEGLFRPAVHPFALLVDIPALGRAVVLLDHNIRQCADKIHRIRNRQRRQQFAALVDVIVQPGFRVLHQQDAGEVVVIHRQFSGSHHFASLMISPCMFTTPQR